METALNCILKRNRKLCCEFVFMFLWPEFEQFCSVAGRSGMTYVLWIGAVVCKSWDRCREGTLDPETGKYSGVVVRLTGLCVKTTWMQVFPFGLEQSYRTSLDGWTSTEVSASQFWLWDELYGLYSDDCQCGLPTLGMALHLVEM